MVHELVQKFSLTRDFIPRRDYREIGSILRTKAWGTQHALGLCRDLTVPEALVPVTVRPIQPGDFRALLNAGEAGIADAERRDQTTRLRLLDAGFSSCFVATTADDQACYIQWLTSPRENVLLQKTFEGLFPPLGPNEMLLEGAYTPVAFRGQRIMPAAMALIAERAAELGAERALTFVSDDNIPSLKGCKRTGFALCLQRRAIHRLGRCRMIFAPLAAGTPYAFDVPPGA